MVAAHTSAGKTVVAEYAIAMALRDGQRVIYTSPLKALSNQKYRELSEEFQDVGLMTGDNVINPNASCVVMTTEILRSMLYRGAQILREVRWVIFDEIHYLRDKERGVVWEESIILQPEQARFVFLSATIPNAAEFASWVAKVHRQPCHVIYTDYRPTPLQHFIFPCGGDGIYLVVDGDSEIKENNFERAMSLVSSVSAGLSSSKKGKGSKKDTALSAEVKDTPEIYKLVKMIIQRAYDPAIVFAFSKKECEALASHMVQLSLPHVSFVLPAVGSQWRGGEEACRGSVLECHGIPSRGRSQNTPGSGCASPVKTRHWHSSWRTAADYQGGYRNTVPGGTLEGFVCHRDVFHGAEYACSYGGTLIRQQEACRSRLHSRGL
eukprot:scaffold312_cov354-Prasinococcus_capsulatus_cf.AAC.1